MKYDILYMQLTDERTELMRRLEKVEAILEEVRQVKKALKKKVPKMQIVHNARTITESVADFCDNALQSLGVSSRTGNIDDFP